MYNYSYAYVCYLIMCFVLCATVKICTLDAFVSCLMMSNSLVISTFPLSPFNVKSVRRGALIPPSLYLIDICLLSLNFEMNVKVFIFLKYGSVCHHVFTNYHIFVGIHQRDNINLSLVPTLNLIDFIAH